MIKAELAKHVYKIDKFDGYAISVDLAFIHNIKLRIIVIYYPAGNTKKIIRTRLTKWCETKLNQDSSSESYQIILGDFNATMNPSKDRTRANGSTPKSILPESKLLKLLDDLNFIDLYRICNEDSGGYTWWSRVDSRIQSKIDYI